MVTDFMGQEIVAGEFVVYPGAGNTKAEYGMILMKVLAVKGDSVTCERLDVDHASKTVLRKKSTIKQTNKLVKVNPSYTMEAVFHRPEQHFSTVAKWLHGQTKMEW